MLNLEGWSGGFYVNKEVDVLGMRNSVLKDVVYRVWGR